MTARLLQSSLRLRALRARQEIQLKLSQQERSYAIAALSGVKCTQKGPIWKQNSISSNVSFLRNNTTTQNELKERAIGVDMVLTRIDSHFQANGCVNAEWFEKLLQQLEAQPSHYNEKLKADQASFLLGTCNPEFMPAQSSEQRLKFFQRLWQYLERNEKLTKEHYMLKLRVLKENRMQLKDYKEFLNEAISNCGLSETESYDGLLEVACAAGNLRQATEILVAMRKSNNALTERNFNALLLGNARNQDLNGCKSVLDGMLAAGLEASLDTQTVLIVAYLENGVHTKAIELLDKFVGQFDATQIIQMIRVALNAQLDKLILQRLVQELPKVYVNVNDVPTKLRNVCIELLHKGKLSEVHTIVDTLPTPKYTENLSIDSYGLHILQEMISMNIEAPKVIEFAMLLKTSGKNTRAMHMAAEIAMRRSPPLSLPYLECLSKEEHLRAHYFWPLMMYNFRRHGESGIIRTLKVMAQYDLASDAETFKQYVLPRLAITLEQPQQALQMFDKIGVKTSLILTPIAGNMLMQQQMKEAINLLELYPTKLQVNELIAPLTGLAVHVRATKRFQQYAELLAVIMRKADNRQLDYIGQLLSEMLSPRSKLRNDLNSLQRFVTEMQKAGLNISIGAREHLKSTLKGCFENNNNLATTLHLLEKMCNRSLTALVGTNNDVVNQSATSFVKHPRDMTLEELDCHLIELEAKHMNTRGVLRRLLQLCVRENKLERALQVKAKCDELKVSSSPGMLASTVDLYLKLKDLPNAEASLNSLQANYPAFQIDEHKHIDFAALLVLAQRYDEAVQLLTKRAEYHKINGGEYVVKNVWQLLVNVAHYAAQLEQPLPAKENLTRNTLELLQKLGYCRSNNTVLGPVIREWLLRGDIASAVEQLRQFAKQYKHTPLQFEIISLLVRLSNGEETAQKQFPNITSAQAQSLLKEVTEIVSSVHGTVNMNSSLLLAFAESGTDNQLRRLIMNPEFRINEQQLVKNCEHLSAEGAVVTLLRLARGARGLNRIINEQNIYNMLLNNFMQSNNYAAALELYESLEADDELKVSQEFLKNLVNLLKVNNVDIPSNIALRAQVM